MHKKFLLLSFVLIYSQVIIAQTVVLDVKPRNDTVASHFGKNRKHYFHFIFGMGSIFGHTDAKLPIDYWKTWSHSFGMLYKRKLSNIYSTGLTFAYLNNRYTLKQVTEKKFPDDFINKHERFVTHGLITQWFHRINFGKRGNLIGTYMEASVGYDYYLKVAHITENTVNGNEVEVNITENSMFNKGDYSWTLRFGRNGMVFYFTKRISPLVKDENGNPDLPVYNAGMEFGLF